MLVIMRALVVIAVLGGAVGIADACPVERPHREPDGSYVANSGSAVRSETWWDPVLRRTLKRAVVWLPARPSMYVHLDSRGQFPSFVDEHGRAVPFVAVPTGIESIPFRLDFLVASGTIESNRGWKWEIDSHRVPTTRSVTVSHADEAITTWLDVDSDASLYLVELESGETIVEFDAARWRHEEGAGDPYSQSYRLRAFVRVVAVYADRRTQVIYERPRTFSVSRSSWTAITFTFVGLLALIWLPRSLPRDGAETTGGS